MTITSAKRILEKLLLENGGNDITIVNLYDYYAETKERTERFIAQINSNMHQGAIDDRDYIIGKVSVKSILERISNGATLESICDDRIKINNGWSIGEVVRMLKLKSYKNRKVECISAFIKKSYDEYCKYQEENKALINDSNQKFLNLIKNFGYCGMI